VLRRLVYVIRRVKPDVLFSNHNTWGGHGQHQAAAVTAIAAFDAAADSSMFSEQLDEPGIALWQPRKMFLRVFGGSAGTPAVQPEGVNDIRGAPVLTSRRRHCAAPHARARPSHLRAFNRGRSSIGWPGQTAVFRTHNFFFGIRNWSHEPLKSLAACRSPATMQPKKGHADWKASSCCTIDHQTNRSGAHLV
jgi:LmbE family N-acetylglucosaminyl deacetylase